MGGATDRRGGRPRRWARTTDPRPRQDLRRRVRPPRREPRSDAAPNRASVSMAERFRRTMGGHCTSGDRRPRDRAQRAPPASDPPRVRCVLQRGSPPHGAWGRRADATRCRAAIDGSCRRDAEARRPPSSLQQGRGANAISATTGTCTCRRRRSIRPSPCSTRPSPGQRSGQRSRQHADSSLKKPRTAWS